MTAALFQAKPKRAQTTAPADSEHEPYAYDYLLAASDEPPVRHRSSDVLQEWVEQVLADLDK